MNREACIDWSKPICHFLAAARSTILVQIDDEGLIVSANRAFEHAAGLSGQAEGLRASDYLLNEDGHPHPAFIDPIKKDNENILVHFSFRNQFFSCVLMKIEPGQLLVGEALTVSENSIMEQMTALTNETIRFSRELRDKNAQLIRLNYEKDELIDKLTEAKNQIKTLSGMIPICSYCKNIRDDKGFWQRVEEYVTNHSEAIFSHGICPDCIRKYFPEMADELLGDTNNGLSDKIE